MSNNPQWLAGKPGGTIQTSTLRQVHIDWLLGNGVAPEAIIKPVPIDLARGTMGADGVFDADPHGPEWFAFHEENDTVLWRPKTGELATEWGGCFALGAEEIDNPGTTAFGAWLHLHASPLDWLRANRRGVVVLRWAWAYEQLRHVERVAVAESLLKTYQHHMRPGLPALAVIRSEHRRAAA